MTGEKKVFVKFLEDTEIYGAKCKKGEILEIWKEHADDLVMTGKAEIIKLREKEIEPEEAKELEIHSDTEEIKKELGISEITKELTVEELKDILGLTVKHDNSNKIITFLCMLSAYTENNQFNISYRAPSSTGKSYIPLELAELFEDVIPIGYASPTSFFHEAGTWDDERKVIVVDFERKILIFMDQPHDLLLQRLRPFLSHDRKEIPLKITDRREKHGLRTKTVLLKGHASVIFCTGSLKIDEQEATRNFLLSPETTQEKLREGIFLKALKRGNRLAYNEWLESDVRRKALKERIRLIKEAKINEIIIPEPEKIAEKFVNLHSGKLKPRHQRDIERIISLIGSLALLNLWYRRKDENNNIYAEQQDIDEAFKIWDSVAICQELNIPPYVWRVFEEVIKPIYQELNNNSESEETKIGLSRKTIMTKYYEVYGRPVEYWRLKEEILPALETAGLIYQEPNPNNRREFLIYVTTPHPYSPNHNSTPHSDSISNNMESSTVGDTQKTVEEALEETSESYRDFKKHRKNGG
jgi:hypothetical protein